MASQLDIGYIEACPKSPPMNISETFSKLCEMIKNARIKNYFLFNIAITAFSFKTDTIPNEIMVTIDKLVTNFKNSVFV